MYNIGDKVWRLASSRIVEETITGRFDYSNGYSVYCLKSMSEGSPVFNTHEHELFPSRQALIDSL